MKKNIVFFIFIVTFMLLSACSNEGICPSGWHLPSDTEWKQSTDYLGGEAIAGDKLKETGTVHWRSPNADATNETGFTSLPKGYRIFFGGFIYNGDSSNWWSTLEEYASNTWNRYVSINNNSIGRSSSIKGSGASVRCVRD